MIVDGRYRVLETMAESETRSVYLTEHLLIKRRMVVKVLRDGAATQEAVLAQFVNEAEVAGRLRHPNIIESTDMGSDQGLPYVVFEHLQGVPLADELARVARMPIRRAVHIARQAAAALGGAHIEGIVHGRFDVSSVFLVDRETDPDFVKVLGLGGSDRVSHGVPAPEQILGGQVDHRVDVWGLGVVLYQMVMGRLPFAADAETPSGRRRIVSNPPLALDREDVPDGLREVILACLEKDPGDRFADMADLFDALEPFETRATRSSSMTIPPPRTPTPSITPSRLHASAFARPSSLVIPMPTASQIEAAKAAQLPPAPAKSRRTLHAALLGAIGVAGAGVFFVVASEKAPVARATAAATPAPAAAPLVREATVPRPQRIALAIASNVEGARVTFRRHVKTAPYTLDVETSDTPELVEISAPGHKTMRYWIAPTHAQTLTAKLVKGSGVVEADEIDTQIALGEVFEVVDTAPSSQEPARATTNATKATTKPAPVKRAGIAKLVKQTGVDTGAAAVPASTEEPAEAPSLAALAPKVDTAPVALPKLAPKGEPRPISASTLESHRIAGSPHIAADNATRQAVAHMGTRRIVGRFKVCVAATGAVTATLAASSGVAAYDDKVLREMRGWRFKPVAVGGEVTAVCAPVAVAYSQE